MNEHETGKKRFDGFGIETICVLLVSICFSNNAFSEGKKCQGVRSYMSNGKPPEIENNVMKINSMPNDSKKVEATLNDITRLTDELRADLKNHKAFSTLTIDCVEEQSAEIDRLDKVLKKVNEQATSSIKKLDDERLLLTGKLKDATDNLETLTREFNRILAHLRSAEAELNRIQMDRVNLLSTNLDVFSRVLSMAKVANDNSDKLFSLCAIPGIPSVSSPEFPLTLEMARKCQKNIMGLIKLNIFVAQKGAAAKQDAQDLKALMNKGKYTKSIDKIIVQIESATSANNDALEKLYALDKIISQMEIEQISNEYQVPKSTVVRELCTGSYYVTNVLLSSVRTQMLNLSWYYKAIPFVSGWGEKFNLLQKSTIESMKYAQHLSQKGECQRLQPEKYESVVLGLKLIATEIGLKEGRR